VTFLIVSHPIVIELHDLNQYFLSLKILYSLDAHGSLYELRGLIEAKRVESGFKPRSQGKLSYRNLCGNISLSLASQYILFTTLSNIYKC
jgi:hypothetical protein